MSLRQALAYFDDRAQMVEWLGIHRTNVNHWDAASIPQKHALRIKYERKLKKPASKPVPDDVQ